MTNPGGPAASTAPAAATNASAPVPSPGLSTAAKLALGAGAAVAAAALIMGAAVDSPNTFRVIAYLQHPVTAVNQPGKWWKAIHLLAFDPFGPAPSHVQPFPIARGQTYDFRIFSRDKKARSRKDVQALLELMGFAGASVVLMGRDRRVPDRPQTSLSEWIGCGTWTMPGTFVNADDPFLFAELRPVRS
jgi:hypothetical protein